MTAPNERLDHAREEQPPTDDALATAPYAAMIRRLPKPERLVRALALSAYVRNIAWQGAQRRAGAQGPAATVDRFMTQLYGATIAGAFRAARERRDE